ncbi:hypothetical protein [Candidatus Enterococcus clewellii]|uniref:Uncharacterized protein n=1 Tax=Candidatus Enterococcus clewellii TaxID=1834193 RepID=A0A242KB20_9ENTE|nr:hypothetical protein [Enterococcus sp. 9E7_DIV0242]OTP18257.1 hypothetical protein A5888_000071 [Enterococcus sp. 9E7_DIV0242]
MNFRDILEKNDVHDPHSFLQLMITEQQEEEDPFFVFQPDIEQKFETNLQFLASEETLSEEDYQYWKETDFLIVCQTIDGDFIGGNTDETFVIPSSLYKKDIEIYPLFMSSFFASYEAGEIESKILPAVAQNE